MRTKIAGMRIAGLLIVVSLTLGALVSCAAPPSAILVTTTVETVTPSATPNTEDYIAPFSPTTTTTGAVTSPVTDVTTVDESGSVSIDQDALDDALAQVSTSALSDAEIEGLLYMREEEKLARDVYLTLYDEWGLPIFQNIASSEQTHTDAVETLIDRHDLEDPAEGQEVGAFTNQALQSLYDSLVETGSQSLEEALRVGAAIEEIDILDLEDWLTQTDEPDIQLVYENLLKGSRNHLRAFVSTLEQQTGETYEPQYLDRETYDDIVNAPVESGGYGRGTSRGGGRGQSQGEGRAGDGQGKSGSGLAP